MNIFGMSFFNSQPENDIQKGHDALMYFHNEALKYPAYQLTLDELIRQVAAPLDSQTFLSDIGMAIDMSGASDSEVQDAMANLADQGQGRIPKGHSPFFNAIGNRVSHPTVGDWLPAVATATVEQVGSGIVSAGSTIINTAKSLQTIVPIAIVGAVLLVIFARAKKLE